MKKLATKTFRFVLPLIVLVTSCEKDNIDKPVLSDGQLEITLDTSYMPTAKIDSALAIWEAGGTTQTIPLRADGHKLTTPMANLKKEGSGMLAVQLFTQTKAGDKPLQWERRFAYTANRQTSVRLAAPASIKDPAWNPRAISRSDIYGANFTLVIALRPEDAYFELKGVSADVAKRIEIVRSFYQNDTTALVASRGWVGQAGNLDSKGNLVNRDHFQNLDGQLAGKAWNKFLIRASFYAALNPALIYETEFVQDKP